MGWQPELDELRERERQARELGGPERVKRQHDAGKLTVRERIDALVDPTSFHEIGAIAGRARYDEQGNLVELTPSNNVFGRATIDGRPVVVAGDDFTVRGGSADAAIREKALMPEQMAHDLKLPKVAMPLRVMVTGEAQTPAINAVLELLGRDETLKRIDQRLSGFPG